MVEYKRRVCLLCRVDLTPRPQQTVIGHHTTRGTISKGVHKMPPHYTFSVIAEGAGAYHTRAADEAWRRTLRVCMACAQEVPQGVTLVSFLAMMQDKLLESGTPDVNNPDPERTAVFDTHYAEHVNKAVSDPHCPWCRAQPR